MGAPTTATPACGSFAEFWPFYVREHSNPLNRILHFIGTLSILPVIFFALTVNPYLFLLLPVCGYGFAWIGHFMVEKNRPATFSHPVWSLLADFKMVGMMLTGKMSTEVRRCSTSE